MHRIWMNTVPLSTTALNSANCGGGDPFVNFNMPSFNVKCSQDLFNLGNPFFSPSLIQKLLTYFFFEGVRIYFSFFSPSLSSPIDRTWKIVRTAGFHTRFRYGKLVVPLVFALVLFVHSRKFTSNIHEYSIFFRGYPNGWTIAYSKYLIMHINI